tara:strand:+ start:2740 stop:3597 length:858 start_codon:yes stop_codon:yes gene_type:complete
MSGIRKKWDLIITPKRGLFDLNLNEIWKYRDLLWFLIKRDYRTIYMQTILGPLWLLLQPFLSSVVYIYVFNKIAKIPTDGVSPQLFYLSGIILWNYFLSCLNSTSNTFNVNSNIFSKVYFPRVIDPFSKIVSNLLRLFIQFSLFLGFYLFDSLNDYSSFDIKYYAMALLPFLIIQIALFGQGIGMIVSSLTTKYRDLIYLVSFGSQLLMYATPIVYPLSIVPNKYQYLIILNPMTSIIEIFRYIFFGNGFFNFYYFLYSFFLVFIIFFIGLIMFNKVEKTFIDTV